MLTAFARDLSTCTAEEIRARWGADERAAIDKLDQVGFEARLQDHNPIYFLATQCWFDNDLSLLHAPLHRDRLCAALLEHYFAPVEESAGLIVLIQRDSFKTTFSHGVFPQFIALRGKHIEGRDERIAMIHHKEQQAVSNLLKLKGKSIHHPWFKATWPEFSAEAEFGTKTGFDWPCKQMGIVSDSSVIAAGMGARLVGFHQDWQLYDDIVTEEHINSKQLREEAFEKYKALRYMLDTKRGKVLCTGTRYHVNDLWAKLLKASVEEKKLYKRVVIKSIEDNDVLSFPTRHSYEVLERKRQEEISASGNDFLWHLQMQNEPKTSGLIATDPSWIRYISQKEVPEEAWRCIFVDPAWKGTKNAGEGDYAAIEVWAFERRGSLVLQYLLDMVHSNELTDLDGRLEIKRLMRKYGVIDVAPEEHGGKSFSTNLLNDAVSWGMPLNIIELKSQQVNKSARIVAFLGAMQAGRVFLCTESQHLEGFLSEFEDYPQIDHDDVLDCAAYTCDPAVAESYVPRFMARAMGYRDESPARRTRHCAA